MGCTSSAPCADGVAIPAQQLIEVLPVPVLPHEHGAAAKIVHLLKLTQDGTRWTAPWLRSRLVRDMRRHDTIPNACRWFAYQVLSGAVELELHYAGLYARLLELGRAPAFIDTIMRNDCHRTLPYMPFFG